MKRVLLAPLDWGLGHATRCVPVIRELQRLGCEVIVAGSGDSLHVLRSEFNGLKIYEIPGYQPWYPSHSNRSMAWAMATQLPKFIRVISAEHKAVASIVKDEKIERLISDNRYGCWSEGIPCAFITHQCNIIMPKPFAIFRHLVARLNARLINRFDVCWIPDVPGEPSLAGELIDDSEAGLHIQKEYIGWLSRFQPGKKEARKYDVLAIFSGPEPQRTLLEAKVLPQLKNSGLKYKVVRGLPRGGDLQTDGSVVNFLASAELQADIEAADLILARSGYSTVLDMYTLGKQVVFIPTPGQTEQEYLARRLTEKRIAFHMHQDVFDIEMALKQSKDFSGFPPGPAHSLLREAVSRFVR